MKTSILFLVLAIVLVLTCLLLPEISVAQPPMPGGSSGAGSSPIQNPIDGGLALLAAAGGVYAIKKLRDRKE